LISEIDEWVIKNACEVIKHQKELDYHKNVTYAINVSAPQFLKREFTHMVSDALFKSGVSGGFLEFEIKESIFSENPEEVFEKMNALRAMDVRIVLDNFGVSHSSLANLRYLPINKIKIDKSFISGVDKNRDDEAIVDAIIAIGDRFKLEVVAEGVESDAQFEFLQSRGVALFQGYYFGHPRPVVLN
jgi:EAL domain-containing protein (putative c-di-GMP-specific phosphodiesterase class I)